MPYSKKRYGSRKKYKKYRRCVKKVKKKNSRVKSPYAVCRASIYGKKKRRKRGEKNMKKKRKRKKTQKVLIIPLK